MIEFDNGLQTATIKLSLDGVYLNLNLNLADIRSEAMLRDSRLGELGPKRLKALLEYVDHGFKVDPKSPLPWKEQFCRALAKECDALLSLPVKLTPEQLREVRRAVRETNVSLERAAQAAPGALGLALESSPFRATTTTRSRNSSWPGATGCWTRRTSSASVRRCGTRGRWTPCGSPGASRGGSCRWGSR